MAVYFAVATASCVDVIALVVYVAGVGSAALANYSNCCCCLLVFVLF